MQENKSVKIVQVDGKDLYLTNAVLDEDKVGYTVTNKYGIVNQRRFRANLDYSLELIKLREVYKEVYGSDDFSFTLSGFEFTKHVCSVTFKYSVKEFNRLSSDTYIRHDVDFRKAVFDDCVWLSEDGQLLGIQAGREVKNPVGSELLGKWFEVVDGKYKSTEKFKTIMSGKKIREWVYENGFYMDGIKFVRFMRSAGSARTGKCLFIDERMYPLIHEWEMCGLEIKEGDECDLAGIESYISLTASSIIGAIQIKPENILLVDDYESVFRDTVVAVEQGDDGHLKATEKEVEISNSIWDGESLIDVSLMGEYSPYGFILLRNSFFKSAAFNCNLQQWFKDNGITEVSQLNGKTLAKSIDQVLYITTPSSIKYLKYGTFEAWLENISETFGVVKHEKKPKFLNGKGVKVSYQLINTLAMTREDVAEFLKPSLDYLDLIKHDIAAFRWHIHFKAQRETDLVNRTKNDVVYRLLGVSDDFAKTKMFWEFKKDSIRSFISELKLGHIITNGNNEVLAGNILELLDQSIGKFNGDSKIGYGNIRTTRFDFNKKLLCCRSPHTSSGNVMLARNVESGSIKKYFNLTTEIVVVNSIRENIMQRLSGCDYDSDSVLITDNEVLIRCAEKYYNTFKVPTVVIDSAKKKRHYTSVDKANLDSFCDNDSIGVIVNLSQKINTIMFDRINRYGDWKGAMSAYYDNCLLSILSMLAIDATKREYPIDCMEELKIIRAKYDDRDKKDRAILPHFFAHVAKRKGYYDSKRKCYLPQMAPMDYLQDVVKQKSNRGPQGDKIMFSISDLIKESDVDEQPRQGYVDLVLSMVRDMDSKTRCLYQVKSDVVADKERKRELANKYYEECIDGIKSLKLNNATMRELIIEMDKPENSGIRRKLWTIVFGSLGDELTSLLKSVSKPIYTLEECKQDDEFDISIYGIPFKKKLVA